MSNKPETQKKGHDPIYGLKPLHFIGFFAVVVGAIYVGALPAAMTGGFAICIALSALLSYLGDRTPIIKDYFGGGAFMVLFGCAFLVYFKVIPEATLTQVKEFTNAPGGFLNFYITLLIAGSLLGVNRLTLRSAIVRYMPCVVACQVSAMIGVALLCGLVGYNVKDAIFHVALPVLGGGIGAGAIPMSNMIGEIWGTDSSAMLTQMTSSIALANALAIISGGLMNRLGKAVPSLTGNGNLIATSKFELKKEDHTPFTGDFTTLGAGFFTSLMLMTAGQLLNKFFPIIHSFAWMIIVCCVIKIFGLFPKYIEDATHHVGNLCVNLFTPILLATIGLTQISMEALIESLTFGRFVLVAAAVFFGCAGAMLAGKLVGFHPIEAGITTGLCATDMGGTGDVAILGAAKRLELLPYAAISTRIGGAVILILAGFVARLFV